MNTQLRAALGDLRIVTQVWEFGDEPQIETTICAAKPGVPGNLDAIAHLDDYDPADLRAFAQALLEVAGEIEQQRTSGAETDTGSSDGPGEGA